MTTEIATYQPQAMERLHPKQIIEQATEEADALASVIEKQKLYSTIQGRRFVKCEGWTTLAALRGCLPREVGVQEEAEGRYIAKVDLVRMSDGQVLTSASAECGGPEDPVWQNRPPNARRSMAITRATGKACRVAFSWVMALSGFEVTPAEEMDFVAERGATQPATTGPTREEHYKIEGAVHEFTADSGKPVWRGTLIDHRDFSGINKNKKPYTKHWFKGQDGKEFATFEAKDADILHGFVKNGVVEITWEPGYKPDERDIVAWRKHA